MISVKFTIKQKQLWQAINSGKYSSYMLLWGRRSGKSTGIAAMMMILAASSKIPMYIGYAVPKYALITPIWNYFIKTLGKHIIKSNKVDKILEMGNGSSIEFLSLDGENTGRSRRYHWLILDEASIIPNLSTKWQLDLQPTLLDFDGKVIFCGTPKGSSNFFSKKWKEIDNTCYKSHATSFDNNYLNPKSLAGLQNRYSDIAYRQEVMGEILPDIGSCFGNLDKNIIDDALITDKKVICYGIDVASRIDATSIIGVNVLGQIVAYYNFQENWVKTKQLILKITDGVNSLMDCTGPGLVLYDNLKADGSKIENFIFTHNSKQTIINELSVSLKVGRIKIPKSMDEIVTQLNNFEYRINSDGFVTMQAQNGESDDDVCALALCNHLFTGAPSPKIGDICVGLKSRIQF